MMSFLAIIGALFLIFVGFKFFVTAFGILIAVGALVLVGLVFGGVIVAFFPLLLIFLVIFGILMIIKGISRIF